MAAPLRCQRPNGLTKRIYRSRAKARQAARGSASTVGKLREYKCPFCGFWHLTSSPDRKGGAR